jgi:hypothetical protein
MRLMVIFNQEGFDNDFTRFYDMYPGLDVKRFAVMGSTHDGDLLVCKTKPLVPIASKVSTPG